MAIFQMIFEGTEVVFSSC